jgi:hypothetical protein
MEDTKNIFLSEKATSELLKVKDKLIDKSEIELSMLRSMEPMDVLKRGISAYSAPFELAGRMIRKGWSELSFHKEKNVWRTWDFAFGSSKEVSWQEVENMLTAEE